MIDNIKNPYLRHRYINSLRFLRNNVSINSKILDIGTENSFSKIMKSSGFQVVNTKGQDFDLNYTVNTETKIEVVTAFEILEHLVSPFPLLQNLPGEKLIATVPLKLWFAGAYRNENDPWDCHYHEFEDWQFDWLIEKSGWKIIHKEKWNSPFIKLGIRPFLRSITPRYYAIYAERK